MVNTYACKKATKHSSAYMMHTNNNQIMTGKPIKKLDVIIASNKKTFVRIAKMPKIM